MRPISFFTLIVAALGLLGGAPTADAGCTLGEGKFLTVDGQAHLSLLNDYKQWRGSWDLIIPGNFGGDNLTDLLFYDRNRGDGELYINQGNATFSPAIPYYGWRRTWDMIIPGDFGGDASTDLLFYDRKNREGEFYTSDREGSLSFLIRYEGWRKTWDLIVPGNFGGSALTDLLFYDRKNREGEFYTSDGQGSLSFLTRYENWRGSWDLIIPGNFGGDNLTDLLFYDRNRGQGELYINQGDATFSSAIPYYGWRKTWDLIVPGNFGGDASTDLLFYDRKRGQVELYINQGQGQFASAILGTRQTWNLIVPGSFGGSALTDLLFYDNTLPPDRPEAPSDLRITGAASNGIVLSWKHNSACTDGFTVYFRRGRQGDFTGKATVTDPSRRNYPLTGLDAGSEYCIAIKAFNAGGESPFSNEVCGTTSPLPSPDIVCLGGLYTDPESPKAGQPFTVYWKVCNNGGSSTKGDFTNELKRDGEVESRSISTNSLSPGACDDQKAEYPAGLPAGDYHWILYLNNKDNAAGESGAALSNNQACSLGKIIPNDAQTVTLKIVSICEGCATAPIQFSGATVIAGSPALGNQSTPFSIPTRLRSRITLTALDTVSVAGKTVQFSRWTSVTDNQVITTSRTLSGVVDKSETLAAIYQAVQIPPVTLTVETRLTTGNALATVPILVLTPCETAAGCPRNTGANGYFSLTMNAGTQAQLRAPTYANGSDQCRATVCPPRFVRWRVGNQTTTGAQLATVAVNQNTTIVAEYQ